MDFSDKYTNTYIDTCNAVRDISMAIQGDKQSKSNYRIIPQVKKGQNIKFNAVDFNTLNETLIFMSKKTIGVKLFGKNHTPISSYSVSRHNGKQIILISYPDGTSMEQKATYNPETKSYVYDQTDCTIFANTIIDPEDYSDEIINQNLKIRLTYNMDPDKNMIRLTFVFINDADGSIYHMEEHPELFEISNLIAKNSLYYIQAYQNCMSLNYTSDYFNIVRDFYSSFRAMLKEIEDRQQNTDKNPNSEITDEPTSPHSDDDER